MIYLLDANSFIEAKHKHYRMRVVPGYWEWLLSQQPGHQIQSIVPVYKELTSNSADKDDLHLWAENHKNLFIGVDGVDTQQAFSEVANYRFARKAPPFRAGMDSAGGIASLGASKNNC